jgi:hypothetical protein
MSVQKDTVVVVLKHLKNTILENLGDKKVKISEKVLEVVGMEVEEDMAADMEVDMEVEDFMSVEEDLEVIMEEVEESIVEFM